MAREGSGFVTGVADEGGAEYARRHARSGPSTYRWGMRVLGVLVLVLSMEAAAKCANEWFDVAPEPGVELPPSAHVLVTLGGKHRTVTPKLEFVAGPQKIAASVVHVFDGMSQRLVLVKPSSPLPPGVWELLLHLPKETPPSRRFGPWKVKKEADSVAPSFAGAPSLGGTDWEEFGCGPGSTIDVKGVTANEPVFIEAAVTVDGKTTTAVLNPKGDVVELGHGMCSGAFDLNPGTKGSVVVTPIDFGGNRGAASGALAFTAPGPTK